MIHCRAPLQRPMLIDLSLIEKRIEALKSALKDVLWLEWERDPILEVLHAYCLRRESLKADIHQRGLDQERTDTEKKASHVSP